MIHTEINIEKELSKTKIESIIFDAMRDAESKLRQFKDDVDLSEYDIEFEFVCRVKIGEKQEQGDDL